MFPLTDTNLLASFIIASTLEAIDLKNLSLRYEGFVLSRKHAGKKPEEIAKELFEELKSTGTMAVGIETNNPYTPAREKDVQFWKHAKDLAFARANLGRLTVMTWPYLYKRHHSCPLIRDTTLKAVLRRSIRNAKQPILLVLKSKLRSGTTVLTPSNSNIILKINT